MVGLEFFNQKKINLTSGVRTLAIALISMHSCSFCAVFYSCATNCKHCCILFMSCFIYNIYNALFTKRIYNSIHIPYVLWLLMSCISYGNFMFICLSFILTVLLFTCYYHIFKSYVFRDRIVEILTNKLNLQFVTDLLIYRY